MSQPDLVIVPCGLRKRPQMCAAGEMYTGPYHRACLKYARSLVPDERILILSAKYGFLPLDRLIEPYDLRMGRAGCVTAEELREQARRMDIAGKRVVALGGKDYTDRCRAVFAECATPLAEVGGMFKQMSEMKRRTQGEANLT